MENKLTVSFRYDGKNYEREVLCTNTNENKSAIGETVAQSIVLWFEEHSIPVPEYVIDIKATVIKENLGWSWDKLYL